MACEAAKLLLQSTKLHDREESEQAAEAKADESGEQGSFHMEEEDQSWSIERGDIDQMERRENDDEEDSDDDESESNEADGEAAAPGGKAPGMQHKLETGKGGAPAGVLKKEKEKSKTLQLQLQGPGRKKGRKNQ